MAEIPQKREKERGIFAWIKRRWHRFLSRKTTELHHRFFQWYSEQFFPIQEHLTPLERAYVERCFSLADWFSEIPKGSDYQEFSYFTYSHRVKGDQVNSSRVAFGSLTHPRAMWEAAEPILAARGVEVDRYFVEDPNSFFYGLGWDIDEGHLKVYFRLLDLDEMPQTELRGLLEMTLPREQRRAEGLVSFSYVGSALYEQKVYVYPLPSSSEEALLFSGIKGRVLMATSRRGVVTQYDVSSTGAWREKLNEAGKALIDTYARRGYTLDTIVMEDADHFTLYFPGAFFPLLGTMTALQGRKGLESEGVRKD